VPLDVRCHPRDEASLTHGTIVAGRDQFSPLSHGSVSRKAVAEWTPFYVVRGR
jgi:hypothetical protein